MLPIIIFSSKFQQFIQTHILEMEKVQLSGVIYHAVEWRVVFHNAQNHSISISPAQEVMLQASCVEMVRKS